MRILFQGDSVTDAGRDKRNYHDLGKGYAKCAAEQIRCDFPNADLEFINLGVGGNRTDQLFDRCVPDILCMEPDVVSLLIGVNDVLHRDCYPHPQTIYTTTEQTEANYRALLKLIKQHTKAKILMIAPFVLDGERFSAAKEGVRALVPTIRKLADEYADVYLPLDEIFEKLLPEQPEPCYYSADGVHPNANGAQVIGAAYAKAIRPLIQSI